MYAISHIEAKPGIWCWAVSFRRRGKAYNRHFYYASRGLSKKEALAEAVAWRDRQLSRVRALSKREFCQIVRKSNHSGVPGVYFLHPKNHRHGVWQAQVRMPGGDKLTKTFSVHKYGSGPAFERAVRARNQMLKRVEDLPYLSHVTAKAFDAEKGRQGCAPPGERHGQGRERQPQETRTQENAAGAFPDRERAGGPRGLVSPPEQPVRHPASARQAIANAEPSRDCRGPSRQGAGMAPGDPR